MLREKHLETQPLPKSRPSNKFDQMAKEHVTWTAGRPRPLLTGLTVRGLVFTLEEWNTTLC